LEYIKNNEEFNNDELKEDKIESKVSKTDNIENKEGNINEKKNEINLVAKIEEEYVFDERRIFISKNFENNIDDEKKDFFKR